MAGRCGIGSRLVILVAVASTLLATWVPPARACACGPATLAVQTGAESPPPAATPCPCCCTDPAEDHAERPCCRAHEAAAGADEGADCHCSAPARPNDSEPTAPPRPADSDDARSPVVADGSTTAGFSRPPVTTPAAEAARGRAGPPPVDLIISLLRITC